MNATLRFPRLDITQLRRRYAAGESVEDVVRGVFGRIAERGGDGVWLHLPPLEEILGALPFDRSLPLFGVPFAVKDNINVAGWPTTAGCPAFRYQAEVDSTVVAKLRAAGAILIGKTNMDQFATGLVGTRALEPFPRNVFDERYLAGGSSSGSAVAVAAGLVSFSLGTDTAGSGRVPAAFGEIIGLKPTRGLLSNEGVVPACRSLDCISIFASTVTDAETVLASAEGFDDRDPFSRRKGSEPTSPAHIIGVPPAADLEFFGDDEAASLFREAVAKAEALGYRVLEIDFAPFRSAAKLLYAGPWVAERLAAIKPFFEEHGSDIHPVVRAIIGGAARHTAVDYFQGTYELARLQKLADSEWEKMDLLLLPTTGTIYTVAETLADPVQLNTNLGYYTNFVNLLDLCGVAIPAGRRAGNGLPFGVTVLGRAFQEGSVCEFARAFLGESSPTLRPLNGVQLAVVGAHLAGEPLNWQLTQRGGELVRACRTAADYRLFALANTTPPKPGLVHTPRASGPGIEVEIWRLSKEAFGDFVAQVPEPMTIGTAVLEDGSTCKSFLCEPYALDGAREITRFGGWRAYLHSLQTHLPASAGQS